MNEPEGFASRPDLLYRIVNDFNKLKWCHESCDKKRRGRAAKIHYTRCEPSGLLSCLCVSTRFAWVTKPDAMDPDDASARLLKRVAERLCEMVCDGHPASVWCL